jgi:hypothetical protein
MYIKPNHEVHDLCIRNKHNNSYNLTSTNNLMQGVLKGGDCKYSRITSLIFTSNICIKYQLGKAHMCLHIKQELIHIIYNIF